MTASTRAYLWPARAPAKVWKRLDYTVVRRGVNGSRWMRAIRSLDYREIAPNRQINGPGESRTPDKRFRKPLLYPSELQALAPHSNRAGAIGGERRGSTRNGNGNLQTFDLGLFGRLPWKVALHQRRIRPTT